MSGTFANPEIVEGCYKRLDTLRSDAPGRWGRMTAHQMVCHLNDSFQAVAGERAVSPAVTFLNRTLIKWVALRTPLPWPKGVPTRPEIAQDQGGTAPGEWRNDVETLRSRIRGFPARHSFAPHPMFGVLSRNDWMVWAFRHVDHHFRQFGI